MDDVGLFLAHAIRLEYDAARRFEDLMHSMQTAGNKDLEGLFRRLGEFSRLHLKEAVTRGGFRDVPVLAPTEFQWPDGVSPEAMPWDGVDDMLDALGALRCAIVGERSGHAFYDAVAKTSKNPDVARLAESFAAEEAAHVAELERWIARFAA